MAAEEQSLLASSLRDLKVRLASRELRGFARQQGFGEDVRKWRATLSEVMDLLVDAEEKQNIKGKDDVKIWLSELTHLAYDLDDVLDDLEYELLRRKKSQEGVQERSTSWSEQIQSLRSRIEEITGRFEEIEDDGKYVLKLQANPSMRCTTTSVRPPTTSSVVKSDVVGRDKDVEAILKLLPKTAEKGDDKGGRRSNYHIGMAGGDHKKDSATILKTLLAPNLEKTSVIAICGLGGLGKTTLAQYVYHHESLGVSSVLRAWYCISDNFDDFEATKSILQQVHGDAEANDGLNSLQLKVKEKISGKRFLIVLDDVWEERSQEFEMFFGLFKMGCSGSAVIVTTRIDRVASAVATSPAHRLQLHKLRQDECLTLFARHALGAENFDAHQGLKGIGEAIVERCDGLPLAIKTLGGLLKNQVNPRKWEEVRDNSLWDLAEGGILPALRLSYHHLSSPLKQCFLYCSIFPKDYEFEEDELILLWMAEGLLSQSRGKRQMEDLGSEYFRDLLSRSFFQPSGAGAARFVMHDLIHDLACFLGGEMCCRMEHEKENGALVNQRCRYSSFLRDNYEHFLKFESVKQMKSLRTLTALPIPRGEYQCNYISGKLLQGLLSQLRCLRVLSLSGYQIEKFPDSVCELKHLRYLNLSSTSIDVIPETISCLYSLQTLILNNCQNLWKLPSGITTLAEIRHLDISETPKLQEMPPCLGDLKFLQTLSKFVVGEGNGLGLNQLGKLHQLRGSISISRLDRVKDVHDACEANLKVMKHLKEITLEWYRDLDNDLRTADREFQVLDLLHPHQSLMELGIISYGGLRFPNWVGDPSFTNLVTLSLRDCKRCSQLPPVGYLPKLEELYISGMDKVESVGAEFYGCSDSSFPSLKTLVFQDMPNWVEWSCSMDFGSLLELEIHRCPKLESPLPRFSSLHVLELEECKERIMRETVGSSSLTTLTLSNISSLTCLPEEFFKYLVALEELTIYSCNELTHLWNNDATLKDLGRLRSLKIYGCGKFRSFFPTGEAELSCGSLHLLTSSQDSAVNGCEILECFPATGLPSSLKKLVIFDCESLWCLPDGVMQRNNKSMETEADGECCLEGLIISGCPSLESFPTGVLPATLRTLWISNCPELESISGRESISGYNFPRNAASSLESIYFNKYPSLKSLPKCLGSSTQLTNLADLTIWNCEGIEWFPEEGLSSLNLRRLGIDGCKNLKSLPNNIQNLTSLEYLVIHCCPSLEWIPPQKGGLPHNLRVLEIYHCERLEESLDWSHHLHTHSALTSLFIEGEFREVVSVLDDDSRLLPLPPPSLNLLRIAGLRNLERISSSRGLNSLRHLKIGDCPMLQNLPNQGILPSLLELYIWGCPLLKPKCLEEEGGEYSSHLSLIPRVSILDSW